VAEADGLIDLHRKGVLEDDSFDDRFDPLETRRRQLAEEIAVLEGEVDMLKVEALNADHITSSARPVTSMPSGRSSPSRRSARWWRPSPARSSSARAR
jgi:hypothetical protein